MIPIPVENQEGIENKDRYIYGGIYWTSGLYQLSVSNYLSVCSYCSLFLVLFGGVHLLKFSEVKNGVV